MLVGLGGLPGLQGWGGSSCTALGEEKGPSVGVRGQQRGWRGRADARRAKPPLSARFPNAWNSSR